MMKFWFAVLLLLWATLAHAVPRCPLDTSNPAITHTVIPLHGGPLQDVTRYSDPSEYPYFTFQEHWALRTALGMPHDTFISEAGIVLLRDDLMHLHSVEVCYPHGGEWPAGMSRIVLPVRLRQYHNQGAASGMTGEMVGPTFWDASSLFTGDPMGVTVATGHFAFDVSLATWGGSNSILRPAMNGWTNFHVCGTGNLDDGTFLNSCAMLSMYTRFVPDIDEETQFLPALAENAQATSARDPGGSVWGSLLNEFLTRLPVLAPVTDVWDLRTPGSEICRTYAGDGTLMASKKCEMRVDMDLHAGIVGRHLNSPFGVLDPAEIGDGVHQITFITQTETGPDGIPGVAGSNELVTALLGFTIEVGAGGGTPHPVDCVVGPWTTLSVTSTPAVTAGAVQTRTTTIQERRAILTPPAHGGAACPSN